MPPARTSRFTSTATTSAIYFPAKVQTSSRDCGAMVVGTASSAFVGASLQQLIAAARLPNSGISEIAVNASLAFIEGAKPQGEIEGALLLQMACTHAAAMTVLAALFSYCNI